MAEHFDLLIRGGLARRRHRRARARAATSASAPAASPRSATVARRGARAHDRRRRLRRRARLRRHPHALRRAGLLGPHADDLAVARRHLGRDGELRLRRRADAPGASRAHPAHARERRGHVASTRCTPASAAQWPFETFPEFLDAIERRGTAINVGALVGHTPVRLYVMGEDATEREATADEIAAMRALVAEALRAGAIGFATSKSPTHVGYGGRPVPSRAASVEEIATLAGALADAPATASCRRRSAASSSSTSSLRSSARPAARSPGRRSSPACSVPTAIDRCSSRPSACRETGSRSCRKWPAGR